MHSNRRHRSHKSSAHAKRSNPSGSGHRHSFVEALEPRQLLSAAASLATPGITPSAIVEPRSSPVVAGSVSGLVTNSSGQGLANVTVVLFTSATNVSGSPLTAKTNASGQYAFPTIAAGTYAVRAEASGYVVRDIRFLHRRSGKQHRPNPRSDTSGHRDGHGDRRQRRSAGWRKYRSPRRRQLRASLARPRPTPWANTHS